MRLISEVIIFDTSTSLNRQFTPTLVGEAASFGDARTIFASECDFRCWHKADITSARMNVCFELKSGHDADVTRVGRTAGFILLNPDPDQLARQIMPLGEPVKRLTGNVFLHDLPLELDAVRTLFGHGFHLSKAQNVLSTY